MFDEDSETLPLEGGVVSHLGDAPERPARKGRGRRGQGFGEGSGTRGASGQRGSGSSSGSGSSGGSAESRGRRGRRRDPAEGEEPAELENPEAVAREVALRQLSMAPRSRAQLAAAMGRKGVPEAVAEAVLDRFEEVSLVDDEAFAEQWVRSRHNYRGLAGRALAHELRHRGVAEETVKEAVAELTPEQELETARALVRRKLRHAPTEDQEKLLRRLVAMLARKGYGPGIAFSAVKAELAEATEALEGFERD